MSKFHSPVSRRDFMKALGLAGAGLGAAAATAPVFHDLDELASSAPVEPEPWFVKHVELPGTTEVDWQILERPDMAALTSYTTYNDIYGADKANHPIVKYWGLDEYNRMKEKQARLQKEWLTASTPGSCRTLKGYALDLGAKFGWCRDFPEYFIGDPYPVTPETMGVPRYQGTPEENVKLITAALRFYGAYKVRFSRIYDDNYRKFFWTKGRDYNYPPNPKGWSTRAPTRRIEFEDVDEPYATETKKVIPNSCVDIITFLVPQADHLTRLGQNPNLGSELEANLFDHHAATSQAYSNLAIVQRRFQRFIRCLGYYALGGGTGGLSPLTSWGVISGLGEMSRMNPMNSWEWGTMIRSTIAHPTNMPIVPTKPMDAGLWRFCDTCKLCADACPYGALSFDDAPSWEVAGWFNYPGKKIYFIDYSQCQRHRETAGSCDNCMSSCPFSQQDYCSIHQVVGATVATTPIFNSFFANMTKTFGFQDFKDPEEWWGLRLPVGGIDTTHPGAKSFH